MTNEEFKVIEERMNNPLGLWVEEYARIDGPALVKEVRRLREENRKRGVLINNFMIGLKTVIQLAPHLEIGELTILKETMKEVETFGLGEGG